MQIRNIKCIMMALKQVLFDGSLGRKHLMSEMLFLYVVHRTSWKTRRDVRTTAELLRLTGKCSAAWDCARRRICKTTNCGMGSTCAQMPRSTLFWPFEMNGMARLMTPMPVCIQLIGGKQQSELNGTILKNGKYCDACLIDIVCQQTHTDVINNNIAKYDHSNAGSCEINTLLSSTDIHCSVHDKPK